jgi:hypothetical protein
MNKRLKPAAQGGGRRDDREALRAAHDRCVSLVVEGLVIYNGLVVLAIVVVSPDTHTPQHGPCPLLTTTHHTPPPPPPPPPSHAILHTHTALTPGQGQNYWAYSGVVLCLLELAICKFYGACRRARPGFGTHTHTHTHIPTCPACVHVHVHMHAHGDDEHDHQSIGRPTARLFVKDTLRSLNNLPTHTNNTKHLTQASTQAPSSPPRS